LSEGHICIDIDEYNHSLQDSSEIIDLKEILKSKQLAVMDAPGGDPKPFVMLGKNVYLHRYYRFETTILEKIKSLVDAGSAKKEDRKKQLLGRIDLARSLFTEKGTDKPSNDHWQLIAAITAFLNNFSIITGGPGTGKTTTVAKLLCILYSIDPALTVGIAAPTGKAAARMNETLSTFQHEKADKDIIEKIHALKASSIHRLLGGYQKFIHNQDKLLPCDVIIIDESSMIDAAILAKLMCAVNNESRLILLGDSNQLSSVEAGSIFSDLCQTREKHQNKFREETILYLNKFIVEQPLTTDQMLPQEGNLLTDCMVELEFSHRFANTSGIGKFSKEVINSIDSTIGEYKQTGKETRFVKILAPEELCLDSQPNDFTTLIDGYKEYLTQPEIKDALKALNKVKVLCATREGKYGMYNLNKMIERYLAIKKESEVFYHNQPILITANNKELGIFNGDIGIIRKDEEGTKMAWFETENGINPISLMHITDFETAFAMTIHKSQGSEYQDVAVVLPPNKENKLLSRELLYTAITRAKEKAFVYSTDEVLKKTIATKVKRISGITRRLQSLK
jgi:exodeoxyribonuclease V alpha subunit